MYPFVSAAPFQFIPMQNDLEDALIPFSEFCGTFASGMTFADSPDPDLDIHGIGPVILPLSPKNAQGLVEAFQTPPLCGLKVPGMNGMNGVREITPDKVGQLVSFGSQGLYFARSLIAPTLPGAGGSILLQCR